MLQLCEWKKKNLDDGSIHACICNRDKTRVMQFFIVCKLHAKIRESWRGHPLPRVTKEFKEYGDAHDFLQVPL